MQYLKTNRRNFMYEMERNFSCMLYLWTFTVDKNLPNNEPAHFSNATVESYFSEAKETIDKNAVTLGKAPIKVGRFWELYKEKVKNKKYSMTISSGFPKLQAKSRFTNKKYTSRAIKSTLEEKKLDPIESWKKINALI